MLNHTPLSRKELTLSISLLKSIRKSSANSMFTGKKPIFSSVLNSEKVRKSESSFMKTNKESSQIDLFTWSTVSLSMSKKAAVMKLDSSLQAESKNLSHLQSVKCLILRKDSLTLMTFLVNNRKLRQLPTKSK